MRISESLKSDSDRLFICFGVCNMEREKERENTYVCSVCACVYLKGLEKI